MSEEIVSIRGRIVSGTDEGTTIAVALEVGDEQLARAGVEATLELSLDDGRRARIETDAQTRSSGLERRSRSGAWDRLEADPLAAKLRDHAPGPHVRASLVREVVELGQRVFVRGRVVAGDVDAPTRIVAFELGPDVAELPKREIEAPRRRPLALGDLALRTFAALVVAAVLAEFLRYVVLWPEQLVHPGVSRLRALVGLACSLHVGIGLGLVLRRRGGVVRVLPRFVDGEGGLASEGFVTGALLSGAFMSGLFGLISAELSLATIAETGDVLARGTKGPFVDAAAFTLPLTAVAVAVGWTGLVLLERRSARLAALFRPRGASWQVRTGRLRAGELSHTCVVSGSGRSVTRHWSASASEQLELESAGERLTIESAGLVWGTDTVEPSSPKPRVTTWTTGPGANVAIAGRLGDATVLRAAGPESLLLVAIADPNPLAALERGLWKRRLILALPLLGALATAALMLLD